jgi:hypothetical protein
MSFPAYSVAADPRGLVILLVGWLEGALLQVFNILSSAVEARLSSVARGGWPRDIITQPRLPVAKP